MDITKDPKAIREILELDLKFPSNEEVHHLFVTTEDQMVRAIAASLLFERALGDVRQQVVSAAESVVLSGWANGFNSKVWADCYAKLIGAREKFCSFLKIIWNEGH